MPGLFASAFLLGLVFNAAPGAVFAETVRRGASGGFRHALAVQFGSLVGDATWAVFGLVGVGLMLKTGWLRLPVGIAGSAYLLWLAWRAWQAGRAARDDVAEAASSVEAGPLGSGAMISLTNPQNVVYWAAMGGALASAGVAEPRTADYAVFFAGFMASSVLWCFLFAAVVGFAFRSRARWTRFANELCAIAFLALALLCVSGLLQTPLA